MEEFNDIYNHYNDIDKLTLFVKSSLLSSEIPKRSETENYIIIMEYLNKLFEKIPFHFTLSNSVIRHIIVCGDISLLWNNDIVIYLNDVDVRITYCINKVIEHFSTENINILEKNKDSIKFVLNVLNRDYTFVIKKKDELTNYKYYFEINQLEYDIKKNLLINNLNNKTCKIYDGYILKLRNLDLLSDLIITTNKINQIKDYLANNPLIIFELIEMLLCFPDYFTVIEIKNIFINLNHSLQKKNIFSKTIKHIFESDNDLYLYKQLIKFSYHLEEIGLFNAYIRYTLDKHSILLYIITNIEIDIELFKIIDVNYFKDFVCLLVFQHLIYNKRKIFKKKCKRTKEPTDLLDVFMNEHNECDSEDNSNLMDFNMLDKYKFSSLKHLKETAKSFSKFDDLIKLIPFKMEEQLYIKNFYNVNSLLFSELKNIREHHSLKLAYIIKRFHFTNKNLLIKIIKLFNSIIKNKQYYNTYLINDNFINIITSKKLNDYMFKKMTFIPKINENFKNNLDCIDILDFQDTFVFFIEFIYKNKRNYNEDETELVENFDAIFEASLCDMRSYRIFKNEKRRKTEKKIKKEKKMQKEIKKNKYKIVKNTILNNLEEETDDKSEDSTNDSISSDSISSDSTNDSISSDSTNDSISSDSSDIDDRFVMISKELSDIINKAVVNDECEEEDETLESFVNFNV